jgi:uncharacterized damage-inducible protein DinB
VSRAAEPRPDDPAGAPRWVGYLAWLRESVIEDVLALPPDERRTTRLPSGWTPLELLSHLLHMERRWFVWGFLGEPVAEPWGDWDRPEPGPGGDAGSTAREARWMVADGVSAEGLAARLRALGERTSGIIEDHPMEARAAPGGRFGEDRPTLGWICFHVLTEYARHAGHLDIATELSRG